MNFIKKAVVTAIISLSFLMGSVGATYAAGDNKLETDTKNCPTSLSEVIDKSMIKGFNIGRTFQCRDPEDISVIVKLANALFNFAVIAYMIYLVFQFIGQSGEKATQGLGHSFQNAGGGSGEGFFSGFKEALSSKSGIVMQIMVLLGIWQLGFLDIFVFIVRVGLYSFGKDAGGAIDIGE